MALRHKFGPITGSFKSPQIRITVWDDAFATVDENDVLQYASIVAPVSIFDNLPDPDPGIEELAGHAWAVEMSYSAPEAKSPEAPPARESGTLARRMNFQAQSKTLHTCLEPIGVYTPEGDKTSDYPNVKWMVNVQGKAFENLRLEGMTVDPLPETRTLDYYAPNTLISDAYADLLEGMCGKFNSATFFGKPAGSLQLVRVSMSERTPNDWEISLGFGYKAPESNVSVCDDIVIPELRGSWGFWTHQHEYLNDLGGGVGEILELKTGLAVVQRYWDEEDFTLLDLPAATYPTEEE